MPFIVGDIGHIAEHNKIVLDIADKAPLASPAFTGTPTGITKAHVGLPLVDNTADVDKPVSTAQATALGPRTGAVAAALRNGVDPANTAAANTTALNALHTSALALGAVVVLPPGLIAVDALTLKVPMFGASRSKTTLIASATITFGANDIELASLTIKSANQTAMIAANYSGITIRDLYVDFDATVTTNWLAFNPYNVDRLRIIGNKFRIGGVQLSLCDDFLIEGNYWDCEYLNTNEPAQISGQSSGQFVNNTVYRTATDGLDLYSSGHFCVVSGNRFIGIRGASGIECKVTMSDDPGNTSGPGNVFEATIISNNILRDFTPPATSTRTGIYAEYVDSRAVPAFSVGETNRGIIITGNVIEDMNVADPGVGIIASYHGIVYTGHNGLVTNNVIRNVRAWNAASPVGIKLAGPAGSRCVGVRIAGNVIAGIEGYVGIETGALDRCQIDDNVIRQDDVSGILTKLGVSVVTGATLSDCSISGNTFELNVANSMGIRTVGTGVLSKTRVQGNTFRDCGASILIAQKCSFTGNIMDNATNSSSFAVGVAGTSCRGNIFSGNHFTMSADYALVLTDNDGFLITSSTFNNTARAVLLVGVTRNGIIDNNVSILQTLGAEFPHYSGVIAADQALNSVGVNKVIT